MTRYLYPAIFRRDTVNDVYYFRFVDFPNTFTEAIEKDELEYIPSEILEANILNYLNSGIPLPRPTSRAHYLYNLNRGEYWRRVEAFV